MPPRQLKALDESLRGQSQRKQRGERGGARESSPPLPRLPIQTAMADVQTVLPHSPLPVWQLLGGRGHQWVPSFCCPHTQCLNDSLLLRLGGLGPKGCKPLRQSSRMPRAPAEPPRSTPTPGPILSYLSCPQELMTEVRDSHWCPVTAQSPQSPGPEAGSRRTTETKEA